jgi:hypothetical protein
MADNPLPLRPHVDGAAVRAFRLPKAGDQALEAEMIAERRVLQGLSNAE